MAAWWGQTIYWMTTIIAVLIVVWVAWSYVSNMTEGYPVVPIIPLLVAGAVWLVGWACRNMLARR
jgi:hypothetical protein